MGEPLTDEEAKEALDELDTNKVSIAWHERLDRATDTTFYRTVLYHLMNSSIGG